MDPRFSESTENDLTDRLASRLGSWSRLAAARLAEVPAQGPARA
ncbi:hypothetical protein [Cellulomonas taurus]|jgi:hypothetical protein|nr:hypothetical protein [Cellulomonas taurus]